MKFLKLALTHASIAARQRALWVASALFALLSLSIMVQEEMPFAANDVFLLAFFAQMLVLLPPIAYAAVCSDVALAPAQLGIGEIERAAPVSAMQLTAARVAGTFAVVTLPSLVLLVFCGFGQLIHGNPWGPLQAVALFLLAVVPGSLFALAFSALAGTVLPRPLARLVAVLGWFGYLAVAVLVPETTPGGGTQIHLASDPVLQAFFGVSPMLDTVSTAAAVSPLIAVVSIVVKLTLVVALLAVASALARRRSFKRG